MAKAGEPDLIRRSQLYSKNDSRLPTGVEYCLIRLNKAYSEPEVQSAMCVQRFDDSLNPAIHTTYRISLRSSSYGKPRDPSLKDIVFCFKTVF